MVSKSHEQMYKEALRKASFPKKINKKVRQAFVFLIKVHFFSIPLKAILHRLQVNVWKTYSPNRFETLLGVLALFCFEYLAFYAMSNPVVNAIIDNNLVSDRALITSVHLAEVSVLVSFSAGVVSICINEPKCRIPLYILAFGICSYVFSKMLVGLVSPDIDFKELPEIIQNRIGLLLVILMMSLFSIPFNGLLAFIIRINAGPTSKTSDAPTAPAPSDLARDLRLSRSRARRSRVGR